MHFYGHCPVGYGYVRRGGVIPPPLDQYPQFGDLPAEIQLEILKHAIGDTARGLAWLEQVSTEWRGYVITYLWPLFLKKNFTDSQIEMAKQLLSKLNQQPTDKNTYRILVAQPLVSLPSSGISLGMDTRTVYFRADQPFIVYFENDGPGDINARIGKSGEREARLVKSVEPGIHFVVEPPFPPGLYSVNLFCLAIGTRCNAYTGAFYVNDPTLSQPNVISREEYYRGQ